MILRLLNLNIYYHKGEIFMRKMLNKKGFSLVELMIVVVIMGILIAVAIPLYGAITKNANNKTCATNIETIKNTCANYYASYDQTAVGSLDDIASMMDDGEMPVCPLDDANPYVVGIQSNGGAQVYCPNTTDEADSDHMAADTGSLEEPPTAGSGTGQTDIVAVLS